MSLKCVCTCGYDGDEDFVWGVGGPGSWFHK